MPLTRAGMFRVMDNMFQEVQQLRVGTQGYAPNETAPFENFIEAAKEQDRSPEDILWGYIIKHLQFLSRWCRATSEERIVMEAREPVPKRINDVINYLGILRAMIEEENLDAISANSVDGAVQSGLMTLGGHARPIKDGPFGLGHIDGSE